MFRASVRVAVIAALLFAAMFFGGAFTHAQCNRFCRSIVDGWNPVNVQGYTDCYRYDANSGQVRDVWTTQLGFLPGFTGTGTMINEYYCKQDCTYECMVTPTKATAPTTCPLKGMVALNTCNSAK